MNEWTAKFVEMGGYDCMTEAVVVGPAILDGSKYGQTPSLALTDSQKAQMLADGNLIAASRELYESVRELINCVEPHRDREELKRARAAIKKAEGR